MRKWVLFAMLFLFGCAKVHSDKRKTYQSGKLGSDQNSKSQLRAAYSIDDLSSFYIMPKDGSFEPWLPQTLYLVGKFPDNSEANLQPAKDLSWSAISDSVLIEPELGVLMASREGEFEIQAKFKEQIYKRKIKFAFDKDSVLRDLADPKDIEVGIEQAKVLVSWRAVLEWVTHVKIVVAKEQDHIDCESDGVVSKTVDATDGRVSLVLKTEDWLAEGKVAVLTCALQVVEVQERKLSRSSSGVLKTVDFTTE